MKYICFLYISYKKRKARLTLGISPDSTRLTGVKAFKVRATIALDISDCNTLTGFLTIAG
jgi:hypothetical protein